MYKGQPPPRKRLNQVSNLKENSQSDTMVRLDKILFISSLGVAPVIAAGYTPSKSPMNASEVINGTGVVTGTAVANSSETKPCIDDATAKALVDKFNYFYININSTLAEKTLTPDFTEWSDSENYSEGNLLVSYLFLDLAYYFSCKILLR